MAAIPRMSGSSCRTDSSTTAVAVWVPAQPAALLLHRLAATGARPGTAPMIEDSRVCRPLGPRAQYSRATSAPIDAVTTVTSEPSAWPVGDGGGGDSASPIVAGCAGVTIVARYERSGAHAVVTVAANGEIASSNSTGTVTACITSMVVDQSRYRSWRWWCWWFGVLANAGARGGTGARLFAVGGPGAGEDGRPFRRGRLVLPLRG
uniref:Uncharacterized protein n=1 Tax=Anopheles melas TaxID=34690 RepID=A0A182UJ27_9DIPT